MNCEKGIQTLIQIDVFSCFLLQIQRFLTLQSLVSPEIKIPAAGRCLCVCLCVSTHKLCES